MSKLPFKVSARTARLIGRENVANAEGAIIELVKNAYDADASICILYLDLTYSVIPQEISKEEKKFFATDEEFGELIDVSYSENKSETYTLNSNLKEDIHNKLQAKFYSLCSVYIIDNGDGMDDEKIKRHWMTIGTENKEYEAVSPLGRVRSGAKGIGRFSLDRLGNIGEMITKPVQFETGFVWQVNWSDFEKESATIDEVTAELSERPLFNYKNEINDQIEDSRVTAIVNDPKNKFIKGTLLRISGLRDFWTESFAKKIFESLEILTPPKGEKQLKIYFYSSLAPLDFGAVNTNDISDYDYYIHANYLNDESKTVKLTVRRNEFDYNLMNKDVFKYSDMQSFPYDEATFKKAEFELSKTAYQLLPGIRGKDKGQLEKVGAFEFDFYFLKNTRANKEDRPKYFYREFNSTFRQKWLKKFGGIRVFKDGFRVRPYGEPNGSAYDWLQLGERQATSPAGVARKGDYKTRPNQVAGAISISRLSNLELKDKSSREGFQESDVFELFKNLIRSIIKVFEDDRSTIAFNLSKFYSEVNKEQVSIEQAQQVLEFEEQSETKPDTGSTLPEKSREDIEHEHEIFKKGFAAQKSIIKEQSDELRLSRALASAGLMISSFAHEFKGIRQKMETRANYLEQYLKEIVNPETLKNRPDYKNPFVLVQNLQEQDEKLKQWMDFALSVVRKDKRTIKDIPIERYFKNFHSSWTDILIFRDIHLSIDISDELKKSKIRMYELDIDTMFDNLITNSIEAFEQPDFKDERDISIIAKIEDGYLSFEYKDSGPGLSKDITNPIEIFEPFFTTKKDDEGNDVGTGLGMWLLKSVVDEYGGTLQVNNPYDGFGLTVIFDEKIIQK